MNRAASSMRAKAALLCVLVGCAHLASVRLRPLEEDLDMRRIRRTLDRRSDVLIFGDSVSLAVNRTDRDRRTLVERLHDGLPARTVSWLASSAYQMRVFEAACRFIDAHGRDRPRVLIVPLNLRSLSVIWRRNPGWRFDPLIDALNHPLLFPVVARPLFGFKYYPRVTEDEFQASPVLDGDAPVTTVAAFIRLREGDPAGAARPETIRATVIANYMYRLKPDDEVFDEMAEIARLARLWGSRAVFYLTPIDYQTATQYLGDRFVDRVRDNIDTVNASLQRRGVAIVDLSSAVPADGFGWRQLGEPINEHLNETGRFLLSRLLIACVASEDACPPR